jgi:hypothetical protein
MQSKSSSSVQTNQPGTFAADPDRIVHGCEVGAQIGDPITVGDVPALVRGFAKPEAVLGHIDRRIAVTRFQFKELIEESFGEASKPSA